MDALEGPRVRLALLALMAALLLHACWRAPYYRLDDGLHVRAALAAPAREWFVLKPASTYFPVTLFSYWLDHKLFGWCAPRPVALSADGTPAAAEPPLSSAPAMRLMNGLYHLLAGFLLWQLLLRLGAGTGLAAFVALAWTGHPMACESVCWIAERKNVLCALFGFGALLAWAAERRHAWRAPLAALLYALACLSKPTALGLLPVFAALEVLDLPRREFHWRNARHCAGALARLAGPLFISAAVVAAGLYGHQGELVDPPGGSAWTALLTDTEIFSRYVCHVLAPADLSFYYGVEPLVSLGEPRVWLYGLGLLAFCGALLWSAGRERRPLAWLGVLWFLGALAPSSNLVAIPYWMQDRYVYLAAAGLLLAVGAALAGVLQRAGLRRFVPAGGAVVVALTGILAAARSPEFAHSDILELEAAGRQPNSGAARLAAAFLLKSMYYQHLRLAAEAGPDTGEHEGRLQAAQRCAAAVLDHYQAAARCADVNGLVDSFTLRAWTAEMLAGCGRPGEALAVLGPLPPPGLRMLPDATDDGRRILRSRKEAFAGYPPRTLATAWLVQGEANLARSRGAGLAPEQRMGFAEDARRAAEESLKCSKQEWEAGLLSARAQLRLAELHAERHDAAGARQCRDAARKMLRAVPVFSAWGPAAQRLLSTLQGPDGPRE